MKDLRCSSTVNGFQCCLKPMHGGMHESKYEYGGVARWNDTLEGVKDANDPPSAVLLEPFCWSWKENQSTILEEADKLTKTDRNDAYGDAGSDFERVGHLMTALGFSFAGGAITAKCVPLLMMCVKLSREVHKHKRDNLVDLCGYAHLLQQIHEQQEKAGV